jgi:hypothetical protein|tara:strand:+ start:5724 stop:5912 length:189 start_codon:yes stop_codon:yes gene_type:complete
MIHFFTEGLNLLDAIKKAKLTSKNEQVPVMQNISPHPAMLDDKKMLFCLLALTSFELTKPHA